MTYQGKVIKGVVVLDAGVRLPEAATVRVEAIASGPAIDLARAMEGISTDPSWPVDGAAELDHYLDGTPKQGQ